MPKIRVILNPTGGRGAASKVWAEVSSQASLDDAEVCLTDEPGHGTALASEAVELGFDRVVVFGGDGTVNEVMNGLVKSSTALAVVPAGTGNDWVRTVGVPNDPHEAWKIAVAGRTTETDVGEAVGHRYFLNIAGVGFDAEVARCIADADGALAKLGPKQRYIASVMKTFFGYRGANATLVIDGEERKLDKLFLLAVAVARFYGSGMMIAPEAEIDDGLFDLVWGRDIRMDELPVIMGKIFKGAHLSHNKVDSCRCEEVSVTSDVPLPFHLDGDVAGTLPVTFKVHKHALKIVVP